MARLKRICPPGIPQHIIQRGNNRQVCFASEDDFTVYAHWLVEASEKYGIAIHAWVFMTDHAHILATPREQGSISPWSMVSCAYAATAVTVNTWSRSVDIRSGRL